MKALPGLSHVYSCPMEVPPLPSFAPSVAFHPPPLLSGCCFLAAAGGLMEVCALSSHRTASSGLGDHRCWGSHDGKPRGCSARTGQQESCQRLWWAGDGALSSEGAQRAQLIQALKQQAAAARRGDSFLKNPLDLESCSESPQVLGAGLVCCSQLRFSVNPSVAEAASARCQLGSRVSRATPAILCRCAGRSPWSHQRDEGLSGKR